MESVVCERVLSLWLCVCTCLCVCATANQAGQQRSDFCLESQSRKQIKEQLNSTTALAPKPNDSFQEALKPLTGLFSLPSLYPRFYLFIYFLFPSPFSPSFIHPSLSWNSVDSKGGHQRSKPSMIEIVDLQEEFAENQSNKTLQR